MKQIVIYKSRTGFTKKYAKWLAQSLNCECIPQEDVGGERLSDYDVIIFGSSFRAGNVEELKWYKETILPFEKTNVLFVTGAMPPSSADAVKSIEQQLGKGEDREVKVFYLQLLRLHRQPNLYRKKRNSWMNRWSREDAICREVRNSV